MNKRDYAGMLDLQGVGPRPALVKLLLSVPFESAK